jgi:hypothetical protein
MSPEEILALPAGRALDSLVAEHIFGWRWWRLAGRGRRCLYPPGEQPAHAMSPACGDEPLSDDMDWQLHVMGHWSTDIAAAWEVVEKVGLLDEGRCALRRRGAEWYVVADGAILASGKTAPHAICRAALLVERR